MCFAGFLAHAGHGVGVNVIVSYWIQTLMAMTCLAWLSMALFSVATLVHNR
jgi:hypothetical protein